MNVPSNAPRAPHHAPAPRGGEDDRQGGTPSIRLLFVVEGNTDIRFVTGLADICDLTLLVPARNYGDSGLRDRVRASGARVRVVELPGNRLAYQIRSFRWLLARARHYDVILSQELLRGTLSASVAGRIRGVPVLAHILIPAVEYYRCRRIRGQTLGAAWLGQAVIRALLAVNGRLVTHCVAWGPFLREVALRSCPRVVPGHYYGIDLNLFRPATPAERIELRRKHGLPEQAFLVLLSSRVSHEKDPETALVGANLARKAGLEVTALNLGGGFRDFLALAGALRLPDHTAWVIGRPAQHPMQDLADFFRLADALVQSSLEEGLALSTLEGLAAGCPVIATAVGGMAQALPGYARLVPRQDPEAVARELLWIAAHREDARQQALRGAAMVAAHFSRDRAFADWRALLASVARGAPPPAAATPPTPVPP